MQETQAWYHDYYDDEDADDDDHDDDHDYYNDEDGDDWWYVIIFVMRLKLGISYDSKRYDAYYDSILQKIWCLLWFNFAKIWSYVVIFVSMALK